MVLAHNLKVIGSNPVPATKSNKYINELRAVRKDGFLLCSFTSTPPQRLTSPPKKRGRFALRGGSGSQGLRRRTNLMTVLEQLGHDPDIAIRNPAVTRNDALGGNRSSRRRTLPQGILADIHHDFKNS